ncbi:MaoC family dehydratase [Neptunicella sp. SCSIO 80796]|uniref:MaoC family dehydratase n=1 Tax=Neptunicella plasticusilytica TaxID=3117012 RepID=UPI003A4D6A81
MNIEPIESHQHNMAGLFFKAAIKKAQLSADMQLPKTQIVRRAITIDPQHLHGYNECIAWPIATFLPPTYIHVLAFQMQLELMVQADTPFAVIGLVHIENQIDQYRPVRQDELLDISCYLDNLQPHPRGWQFDLVTEAFVGSEQVWRGVSTNLSRCQMSVRKASEAKKVMPMTLLQRLSLPSELGRQYAKYSGDYNPIHLFALSAKLFGFKRQIAHGMWSKARCLAALSNQLPPSFNVQVRFMRPVFLPAEVELHQCVENQQLHFDLTQAGRKSAHLQGVINLDFSE